MGTSGGSFASTLACLALSASSAAFVPLGALLGFGGSSSPVGNSVFSVFGGRPAFFFGGSGSATGSEAFLLASRDVLRYPEKCRRIFDKRII